MKRLDDSLKDFIAECKDLSYFECNLVIAAMTSSLAGNRLSDGETSRGLKRYLFRAHLCFFHTLWYDCEGTCLALDVLRGDASDDEWDRLRSGDLKLSTRISIETPGSSNHA